MSIENESTIRIPVTEEQFLEAKCLKSDSIYIYNIPINRNLAELSHLPPSELEHINKMKIGAFRFHEGKYQYKQTQKSIYRYYIYEGKPYLVLRTVSVEIDLPNHNIPDPQFIFSCKIRKVVYQDEDMRICYTASTFSTMSRGREYFLEGEIEYDDFYEKGENIAQLRRKEKALIAKLSEYQTLGYKIDAFHFDCINIPSRPFGSIQRFSQKGAVFMFKWDGFKGRFFQSGDKIYYSAESYLPNGTIQGVCDTFGEFIPHVWYQFEVLKSKIILTDILGIRYDDIMWGTDPYYAIKELEMYNITGTFMNLPVYSQKIINVKDSIEETDGKIAIYKNELFKMKYPTFDLCIKKGQLYYDRNILIPTVTSLFSEKNENKKNIIIEVEFTPKGKIPDDLDTRPFEVDFISTYFDIRFLRHRNDRVVACSSAEFISHFKDLLYVIKYDM